MFLFSVGICLQPQLGAGQWAQWTSGEAQNSCSLGLYFELTPDMSCLLFPGSLLLELGHMRHLGLSLGCVDRHFFHGESSVLVGTAT